MGLIKQLLGVEKIISPGKPRIIPTNPERSTFEKAKHDPGVEMGSYMVTNPLEGDPGEKTGQIHNPSQDARLGSAGDEQAGRQAAISDSVRAHERTWSPDNLDEKGVPKKWY